MLEDTLRLNPPVWFNCPLCLTVYASYLQNPRVRGSVLDRINLRRFRLFHLHNKLISRSLVYINKKKSHLESTVTKSLTRVAVHIRIHVTMPGHRIHL